MKFKDENAISPESAEERIKELEAEKAEIEKELEKLSSRYARLPRRRGAKKVK